MTRVTASAAAVRAAFTVGFVTLTPRRRSAVSGLTTTLPVPLTLIVCSGGLVVSTALIGRGAQGGCDDHGTDEAAPPRPPPQPAGPCAGDGDGDGRRHRGSPWACRPTDPGGRAGSQAAMPRRRCPRGASRYAKKSLIAAVSSEKAQRSVTWPSFMW